MFRPRHSGSRGTLTSIQRDDDARHLAQHRGRVGHVLEHLHRGRGLELAVRRTAGCDRRRRGRSRFGRVAALPTPRAASGPRGRCRPRAPAMRSAHCSVSTPSPHPTSRIEPGAALVEQLEHVALESGHQPLHDRVGRAVLVVGVAGRDCGPAATPGRRPCSRRSPQRNGLVLLGRRAVAARPAVAVSSSRGTVPALAPARSARARRPASARSGACARACAGSARGWPPAGRR